MRDKTPTKVICRIITLITYCLTVGIIIFMNLDIELPKDITKILDNYRLMLISCAIPLLIMFLIALVLKYKIKEENRVSTYRIIEVITRIICTVPISLTAIYYINKILEINIIANSIIGIIIFYLINLLMRFSLQETLSTSFITSDNL